MKNKKKNYFFLSFIFFILFFISSSYADKKITFLTLKNNEVNLRQGPSFEYPIKLIYKKKYLPVKILDKSETWRKIYDFQNNTGWIHVSQLSKKKSAINIKENSILHNKPSIYSRPVAKLETGRLVIVKKCKPKWCRIKTGVYKGWVLKNSLWGKVN